MAYGKTALEYVLLSFNLECAESCTFKQRPYLAWRAGVAGIVNAKIKKTLDLAQLLSKNALSQNGYGCAFVFLCVAMWLCPTAKKWPFGCTAAPEDLPLKIYP